MKKLLLSLVMACSIITTNAVQASAPIEDKPLTTEQIIEKTSLQFNQDPKLISKISFCESSHKVLPHDGGRGVNMTGIHDATFMYWLPEYEKDIGETLVIGSTYDSFKMMSWAFSKDEKHRNAWTTYTAYKKGGTWTFYSRLMKRVYTVHCK